MGKHRQKSIALAIALVVMVVTWAAWRAGSRKRPAPVAGPPGLQIEPVASVEAIWANGTFTTLQEADPKSIRDRIELAASGEWGRVDEAKRRELVNLLAEHVISRASPSPEEYLKLVKQDSTTRWLERDDPRFHELEYQWSYHGNGDQAVFNDPERRAQWLIEFIRSHWNGQFTGVRLEAGDICIRSARIRTEEQLRPRLWQDMPAESRRFWIQGPASPAIRIRTPKRPLTQVLEEFGSTDVVDVYMVVSMGPGKTCVWETIWYWDSLTNQWSLYLMGRRGWGTTTYF